MKGAAKARIFHSVGQMTSREKAELVDVIPAGNTLGEGILWDARGERLWWTDIQERQLLRCEPNGHRLERFALPERLVVVWLRRKQR